MNSGLFHEINEKESAIVQGILEKEELPIPVVKLGKELGLKLFEVSNLPLDISGKIQPSTESNTKFEIQIASRDPRVRKRFTIAHEIAHYLLHRDQIGNGISDDALFRSKLPSVIETQANQLAADILMPLHRLVREHDKIKDFDYHDKLEILSSRFGVSGMAMKIRLRGIKVFEEGM